MDFEDQRRMFAMNMGGHPMANHHATNQQAVQQAAAQQAVQQVAQQVAQPPPPHTRILMPEASLPMVVGTRPGPMDTTMATITTQMAGTQQITMHHTVHQQQLAHHQQQQQAAQQQVAQQQIAQQQQHIEVAVGITDTSGEPGSSLVGVLEEGTEVKRVEQQDPLAIDVGGGGGEMAAAGHSNMEQSRWCLVCDKGLPTQDTSQEFVDLYKATMTVSQRKLSAMLGRLVGLTLYKAHSDVLCRRCYGLVDQVDGLEIELADTKMELVQQYEATIAHRQPHAKKEIERPTLEVDVEWEESNESEVVDNDEDDPDCTATGTKRKKKRKTKRKGGRPRKVKLTTKIKIDSVSEGGDADADGRPRKRGRGRPRKKDKEEDDYIPPGAPTKDCPACKKVVHAKKYLIHLSTHRLFPCPFCESVFKRKDAHNSILDYDKKTHLFAVYDGHGGHEVAAYTALKLPDFLKETEAYKNGLISQALTDTFLGFDATLVKPEVVSILKQIAGTKDEDEEEEEDNSESESEEMDNLYREATMPLDEVIAKYAENPQISRCKKEKGVSPFLKAKSSKSNKSSDSESPVKFALEEEDAEKSPVVPQSSSSGVTEESNTENVKVNSEGNQNGTKVETDVEVNGDETKHMVNGEGGEEIEDSKKIEKTDTDEGKLEECKVENGDTIVNGGEGQETGKGKGKGGKGGKGKAVLKNSEVQAMKAAKAKEKRREAAIKAAEIYRKIQEGGAEEDLSDEEEDDEDDNFEDEGGEEEEGEEDADGEESEDEDDDEEEEDVETEDDEDPYTEFAMNMKEEPGFDSGCTACVALIQEKMLYVANVGDSRCVVSRNGKAVEMSLDHKPEDDPEAARIIKAGGRVTADGRVNGGLNLSRAIGDHGYKQNKNLSPEEQMISPLPDVRSMALEPEDNFMIVACDGIWNSLSSQEACDFVSERLNDGTKITKICEELFDHCLAPDTHGDGTGCDNMTCIIISFKDKEVQSCGNKRTSKQADNDDSTQDAKKVKSDGE